MARNRHWRWELRDLLINGSWHTQRFEKGINITIASTILDDKLFEKLEHEVRALSVTLEHLKEFRVFLYMFLIKFDVL